MSANKYQADIGFHCEAISSGRSSHQPQRTQNQSNSTEQQPTQTGAARKLIFPQSLSPAHRDAIEELLITSRLPTNRHQALLDKLNGSLRAIQIRSPVGYARRMIERMTAETVMRLAEQEVRANDAACANSVMLPPRQREALERMGRIRNDVR